ncbi:hypothetical protein TL16_g06782 [Triparma laevis f. inornata]|uniref:Uncharacterized protein n=1 Tax=Triparma laevis f. inornata TaxID=1714386 RepID=A0A9W7EG89_9STRA|nr:hypothetical protein TL16_g06782 [Triparma laevis f. inornata]
MDPRHSFTLVIHFIWIDYFLLNHDKLINVICSWEVLLAFLGFVCRNSIISIKYAYYNKGEREGLRMPPPKWTDEHQKRKSIASGWRFPMEHQNLVEDEMNQAQALSDVHLQAASFTVDEDVATILRRFDCHLDYLADNHFNKKNEVTAGFIVHQCLRQAFGDDLQVRTSLFIFIAPFFVAVIPNAVRISNSAPPFGETIEQGIILVGIFAMRYVFFSQLFLFGSIAILDFRRRRKAMKLIGKMVQYPGVRLDEFLNHRGYKGEKKDTEIKKRKLKEEKKFWADMNPNTKSKESESIDAVTELEEANSDGMIAEVKENKRLSEMRVFVDLRKEGNAFAWVLSRRTTKMFGNGYNMKVQAYVGVLFFWALAATVSLNALFWGRTLHYVGTPYYIIVNVFLISLCVLRAISEATKLQGLVTAHRMILKNEIFAIQQTLLDNDEMEKQKQNKTLSLDERMMRAKMPISPFRRNSPVPKTFKEKDNQEKKLKEVKELLMRSDDLIGYQEEIHLPVNVMGFHATSGVYNSTVGILVTFFVLATEGWASGGLSYINGWASFAT